MRNFFELLRSLADMWEVYDNSHGSRTLIAIGSGDDEEIADADLWDRFRRSADDA